MDGTPAASLSRLLISSADGPCVQVVPDVGWTYSGDKWTLLLQQRLAAATAVSFADLTALVSHCAREESQERSLCRSSATAGQNRTEEGERVEESLFCFGRQTDSVGGAVDCCRGGSGPLATGTLCKNKQLQ